MRRLLRLAGSRNDLLIVQREVSRRFEASRILREEDGRKVVLMEKVGSSKLPLVGNLLCRREYLLYALNIHSYNEAYEALLRAMNNPLPPEITEPPQMEKLTGGLDDLPALYFYEKDGGPYITSAVFVARDPEYGFQNASIHRVMVRGPREAVVRIVPRHLYRMLKKAEKRGETLPVAVVIGADPIYYIAAATSPPYGVDELYVANTLSNGRMQAFEEPETGLIIPSDAEVVITGELSPFESAPEGPFVDITGTYDIVRSQPVLKVKNVYARPGALFYAILPAGLEHKLLMGFSREAAIWDSVRRVVPDVKAVRLTPGGCGWLHAVISIRKQKEGDAKNAILAALAAHPSLKLAIVVDEDINVDDPNDVEWAIATRFQPHKDLVIITGARGSSLDPSADQKLLLTSKWGIDATKPLNEPEENYTKAIIPSYEAD